MTLNKYFNRKFKTKIGVERAIKIKGLYDYCRINIVGDTILSQRYGYKKVIDWEDNSHYYTITNLVFTKNMVNDLNDI